jgi:amidase
VHYKEGAVVSDSETSESSKLSRRTFLHYGAFAAALAAAPGVASEVAASTRNDISASSSQQAAAIAQDVVEASIAELQARMRAGKLTARELVLKYVSRINGLDQSGPMVRSVLEVNPDALAIADALDAERRERGPRGPLHGIPILLKDNIDTADTMLTTAGSLALVGSRPAQDATVAKRLRDAGAILLGKTNLSEWANFRSSHASSGWSGRGGQGRNPYVLDRNPCGSSSGSAQAVSASFAAAALGTETDGSIVCPSSACGVVGIKPTVGLTSRAGVIPISHSQDTVGPHGRTVADAAAVLGALVGIDSRDPATAESAGKFHTDYTQFLDPNGLRGARIGVVRELFGFSPDADRIMNAALGIMQYYGAVLVDPVAIPSAAERAGSNAEFEVLLYEFKADLNAYLASRVPNPRYPNAPMMRTLADIIAFNEAAKHVEMKYFGQDVFLMAEAKGPLTEPAYLKALEAARRMGRQEGIDAVMNKHNLDVLVAPTGSPAWPIDLINGDHFLGGSSGTAAVAGYPLLTVPAGYANGLPVGITFMGRAYSEPTLIKIGYGFEQASKFRRAPQFISTLALSKRTRRK